MIAEDVGTWCKEEAVTAASAMPRGKTLVFTAGKETLAEEPNAHLCLQEGPAPCGEPALPPLRVAPALHYSHASLVSLCTELCGLWSCSPTALPPQGLEPIMSRGPPPRQTSPPQVA